MSKIERFLRRGKPSVVYPHVARMKNPVLLAGLLDSSKHQNFFLSRKASGRLVELGPSVAEHVAKYLYSEDMYAPMFAVHILNATDAVETASKHESVIRKIREQNTIEGEVVKACSQLLKKIQEAKNK
ncbi:MAG TPA: hypothetical protein VGQ00_00410 [Candidatus Norongarragalinales archaeon]|jgi:hypothetical protein|nr:hypothetical protein [Candidatus Norongarragalinales archaeon]